MGRFQPTALKVGTAYIRISNPGAVQTSRKLDIDKCTLIRRTHGRIRIVVSSAFFNEVIRSDMLSHGIVPKALRGDFGNRIPQICIRRQPTHRYLRRGRRLYAKGTQHENCSKKADNFLKRLHIILLCISENIRPFTFSFTCNQIPTGTNCFW